MAMISAARNVSRYYKLPGRQTLKGLFVDKCFDNHIKNQCVRLLNKSDIYVLHIQGNGETIKDTPLINILARGGFTYLYHSKIFWTIQVTSQVVTIRILFFCGEFL